MVLDYLNFKICYKLGRQHDWNKMAKEMEDSKWFYQVGRRGKELQDMVLGV